MQFSNVNNKCKSFLTTQYKTWTADYGLGIKRGMENTDWV